MVNSPYHFGMFELGFRFHHGALHFPQAHLWLDAHDPIGPGETVFVSHAHSDHTGHHARVLFTPATQRLMRARVSGTREEHVLEFGRRYSGTELGVGLSGLTLLPAGHIFGSAMALLEDASGSLLYTGDFKLRPGLSAERCEPRPADVLVMETTYGRPEYVFPPTADVLAGIIRFCREAIDNDEVPVLLGYSLGKSQEMLSGLTAAGLPVMVHSSVARLTRIYEDFGVQFPAYEEFDPGQAAGKVVLAPPGTSTTSLRRRLGRCQMAVLTGWALNPGCHFRYQADAAFPLSDHADFPDLVAFVQQVKPKRVYTLHGFAAEFAAYLRRLGFDARALGAVEQLELTSLEGRPETPAAPSAPHDSQPPPSVAGTRAANGGINSFSRFAETCQAVGQISSKLEKCRLLADYLATVDSKSLAAVVTWFTGLPFASIANQSLSVGFALLRSAVQQQLGVTLATFRSTYQRFSDTGETVAALFAVHQPEPAGPTPTLDDVQTLFTQLAAARGPTEKEPLLREFLRRCGPQEARFLVKILTGDLRIGLKEGLVGEAVAQAFHRSAESVRSAHQILGDLGETAALARADRLAEAGLTPFRPFRVMLASPEPDAASILERAAAWSSPGELPNLWLEDKYDGIRCQLHQRGSRVTLYSRDLKDVTDTFPELVAAARRHPGEWILDGEVIAMDGERVLPFAELQRRLGRREGDLFLGDEVPVRYLAFDLLWSQGQDWMRRPLRERRQALDALDLPASFRRAHLTPATSDQDIDAAFLAARARGNEGLMIKDPASPYSPGRRGLNWLKLKRALATLDCVVVGAEYGHGKRHGVLSDYTFAVRDERTQELKVIGKAYSGLTNAEIDRLTEHFLARVVRQTGRRFEVVPDLVLEIAFDSIQPSPRHNSGLALRFPRIARIRDDKTAAEIDTLAQARRLAGLRD